MERPASERVMKTRFFNRASIAGPDQCWEWKGSRSGEGYGYLHYPRGSEKRNALAHRFAKEMATATKLTRHQLVHHICENRLCVNPRHLEVVTEAEHHERHRRTHCKEGHELTPENTVVSKAGRICRICLRAYQNARRRRIRAERERET